MSAAELKYVREGVTCDIRADGRRRGETRRRLVVLNELASAAGTARVTLGIDTEVFVVVKLQVASPNTEGVTESKDESDTKDVMTDTDDVEESNIRGSSGERGFAQVHVRLSPTLRGQLSDSDADDMCVALRSQLRTLLRDGAELWRTLCIVPGRAVWALHIDVVVERNGGAVLDAANFAIVAALKQVWIPPTKIVHNDDGEGDDFELIDDVSKYTSLDVSDLPLCLSFCRLGSFFVVDASSLEEKASEAKIAVAVDRQAQLCATMKLGAGAIQHSAFFEMTRVAKSSARDLFAQLDAIEVQELLVDDE